jgi:hypothetical protein
MNRNKRLTYLAGPFYSVFRLRQASNYVVKDKRLSLNWEASRVREKAN